MLAPRPPGRSGDGFAPAKQLAEISLAQVVLVFGLSLAEAIAICSCLAQYLQLSAGGRQRMHAFRRTGRQQVALSVRGHDGPVPAMQSGAAFSGSARAAAIAVGTLDTPAKEFVRPFPKQVSTCGSILRPLQSHVSRS